MFDLFVDRGRSREVEGDREAEFQKEHQGKRTTDPGISVQALKADCGINALWDPEIQTRISSILSQAGGLNITD